MMLPRNIALFSLLLFAPPSLTISCNDAQDPLPLQPTRRKICVIRALRFLPTEKKLRSWRGAISGRCPQKVALHESPCRHIKQPNRARFIHPMGNAARVCVDANGQRRHLHPESRNGRAATSHVRRRTRSTRCLVARRPVVVFLEQTAADIAGMNDVWRVRANGRTTDAGCCRSLRVGVLGFAIARRNKTIAITARGTVSGQWWRHGRSHLDESELWLVHNVDAGAPTYERLGEAGGAKDAWPQFAPDGQSVYYMSDRDGNENLWQKPLKGAAKKLTSFTKGRVLWPSVANNGSAIVFERDFGIWRYDVAKGQAVPVNITLRGAAADAVPERQNITQGFQSVALSPDGKKLAFLARGEVFVAASRDGGDAVRLTQTPDAETDVTWLPDSRRAVYASSRENNWRLFQYDVTTRTEKAITTIEGRAFGPRVSPDGKWIAYRRNGKELRLVTPDGLNDHKLADGDFGEPPFANVSDVTWSPDSRWVAYLTTTARGFATVMVVPVDGGVSRPVSFSANSNGSDVEWSPDGTFLMYLSSQRTETPQLIRMSISCRARHIFAKINSAICFQHRIRSPARYNCSSAMTIQTRRDVTTTRQPTSTAKWRSALGKRGGGAMRDRRTSNLSTIVFEGHS